jgi:Uma2 family endonuclease
MVTTIAVDRIQIPPGNGIVLTQVSWGEYENLLQAWGDHRSTRFAYDRGWLEVRMPSPLHEIINRLLAKIIFTLAEELGLEANDLGSTTFNRPDLARGIEPDSCFYIQNAHLVSGLDPKIPADLGPDLALEVDITSFSDRKFGIYASLGVQELWHYKPEGLSLLQLQSGRYQSVSHSVAFPAVSATAIGEWIALRGDRSDIAVIRAVREFCRTLNP